MSRLLILAVTAMLSAGAPVVHDKLAHPSFEEVVEDTGLPAGWHPWHEPSAAAYSLADAVSGVACVAIVDDSPKISQGLRSEPVRVEPGAVYRAGVWTKILGGERPGAAVYLEFWQGGTRIENYSRGISKAPEWTQISVQHAAPPGAETATLLVYSGSTTIVHSLFDDASLERVDGG
ncbi:MAG: hypothetical protein J7M38_14380 [Armatimonadetes bacterium]|nr:hypothetical protein [Armatimonadota bacterium]